MNWAPMIEKVLLAYKNHISRKYGNQVLKVFNDRYENDQEAGVSEALVFNWLFGICQNPELNEDLSTGGADFICRLSKDDKYVVEVTSAGKQALTDATGCHMIFGQPMFVRTPTSLLRNIVTSKAGQLAKYEIPTVLVITSLHPGATSLFNQDSALKFLVSDWAYSIPVGGNTDDSYLSTEMKQSIFYKPKKGDSSKVVPCRQTISTVLLMAISSDSSQIIGILHPDPIHPFNIHALKKVPFIKMAKWPIEDGRLVTEWVISDPPATGFSHETFIK